MLNRVGSVHNNKKIRSLKVKSKVNGSSLIIILMLLSLVFVVSYSNDIYVSAGSSTFTPASPSGNISSDINVENEYTVFTLDVGSCWMFDWGDGNYSNWIKVGDSDTFISQTHSWDSYGVYEVRVKHRSRYMVESSWSPPLIVTIEIPSDLDGDGWINDIEESYGTNPDDPDEYPLDTDGDGTPDEDSSDEEYTGDSDDDNDGLSDELEESLGSNPKYDDVISFTISETDFYLVDINADGNSDILYNSESESQSKVLFEDGKIHLDINGDSGWDYTYHAGSLTPYEPPFPWLYVITAIIIGIIFVLFLLFKAGIFYLYEEEYVVEE